MNATDKLARLRALLEEAIQLAGELQGEGHLPRPATTVADEHVRTQLLTPTGKIRGLSDRIIGVLREKQEPMTAAEITDAVYDRRYGLTYDAMKRRVAVCTSSLHKRQNKLQWHKIESGEICWYLTEWSEHGKLAWRGAMSTDRLLTVSDALLEKVIIRNKERSAKTEATQMDGLG
ncbi:MAG: hypothetical protein JNL05_11670 [Flavobacteriales bacterium]|nr:hypothetical protein [Flavobacteriales bacterium]